MSEFVRSLPDHGLTYEAREMACHFADDYKQRLRGISILFFFAIASYRHT